MKRTEDISDRKIYIEIRREKFREDNSEYKWKIETERTQYK